MVKRQFAFCVGVLSLSGAAMAYSSSYLPYLNVADSVVSANTMNHLSKHLYGIDSSRGAGPKPARLAQAGASTVVGGSVAAGVPAKLAAPYPAAQRADAQRTFAELLDRYRAIERQFSIPANDMAGAVAAFIAGNYMAYRSVDFPDAQFPPLVLQMRGIIAANPEYQRASAAQKQEMYEQMAILGMFMASMQMALKEKPDATLNAKMKRAAEGYLEQFLKTDAQRVQITDQGMVLR